MTKKTKISVLIIVIYFLSLFVFEFFIGAGRGMKILQEAEEKGVLGIFTPMITFIEAGMIHFICVSIIAIFCRYNLSINKTYKHITYIFPLLTFIFSIPVGLLAVYLANYLNLFGL